MKTAILQFSFLSVLLFGACKEVEPKTNELPLAQNTDTIHDKAAATQTNTMRYVLALNGLSLRKENTLGSEKLTIMPLGSAVALLEAASDTLLEVEHIKGGMHKIAYQGETGYAFSGFLGNFELPIKDEDVETYMARLKKKYPHLTYKSEDNDPDFHEGYTETFTLPANNWPEAYYATAATCHFPKRLGLPASNGPDQETMEDPEKPADAWSSYLTVTRKQNELQTIEYAYRTLGFGSLVTIERDNEKEFRVTYLRFVD